VKDSVETDGEKNAALSALNAISDMAMLTHNLLVTPEGGPVIHPSTGEIVGNRKTVSVAKDGNVITKADEGTGTGGAEGQGLTASNVDDKAVDETLKALRTCLTRLVPKVKRKPVTVTGIRGMDAAQVRNEAHWQGVTDAIIANQPNQSRDPGMAQYLAGR
jgi:hypothetical protein